MAQKILRSETMRVISRIDTKSFTKFYGSFGLLIGIVTGVFNWIAYQTGGIIVPDGTNMFVLFVLNVVIYTLVVYLGALIFALFYNKMAKSGHGIKVELR